MRTQLPNGVRLNKQATAQVTDARARRSERMALNKLQSLVSVVSSRAQLQQQLGMSYGTDRDLYTILGYPKTITFSQYNARFTRQDIAKRVITAFPDATWTGKIEVSDNDSDDDSPFEEAWKDIVRKQKVYHYLRRVDTLSRVGQYAVLLLGFGDGKRLNTPVLSRKGKAAKRDLLFLQPYAQNHASILKLNDDTKSERFGMPDEYEVVVSLDNSTNSDITGASNMQTKSQTQTVHWTRLLHVAPDPTESDVYGTPALEAVYNRLQDLELTAGGSTEMFWRGAFPGMAMLARNDAEMDMTETAMEDQMEDYIHGLSRYLKLQGMDVQTLSPNIAPGKDQIMVLVALVSGCTGIPMRILLGSERGELASTQDKKAWDERINERRTSMAEPLILRPFVNSLIEAGVLPEPEGGTFTVKWPEVDALSSKDMADVEETRMKTLKLWLDSGGDAVIPALQFLTEVLHVDQDKAEAMLEEALETIAEEDEDRRLMEEEENTRLAAEALELAKATAIPPPAVPPVRPKKPVPPAAKKPLAKP